ncbi:MAG: hypothetical protein H0V89_08745 [Deltaproteobacteria bacterium]|nr:hypothetical protein [Deltaproteobacteria bacterium]
MALRLPRLTVDLSGTKPKALTRRLDHLRPGELTTLLETDRGTTTHEVDRCLRLAPNRWAVGRRRGDRTVWRIIDEGQLARLGHPAWLWTKDWWFDPRVDEDSEGPAPAALPLRNQIRYAAGIGSTRLAVKVLASLVACIRANSGPVAVRMSPEVLGSPSHPSRWLVLALLTCLPPSRRESLRLAVGEPEPDPERVDVVIVADNTPGFQMIDAADPPGEGDDLVAYFVRNRLLANDPEAVESAALRQDEPGTSDGDAWGDAIKRLIRSGVPGLSTPTEHVIEQDPESAVRMIVARIRAGAEVDEPFVADLLAVTRKARDPRPWLALRDRSAAERGHLVGRLLAEKIKRPRPELVRALAALYPESGETDVWCSALLGWIREGSAWEASVEALEQALLTRGGNTPAGRLSVWQEAVHALVDANQPAAATRALVSPIARSLADAGLGRALVAAWFAIPPDRRDHSLLVRFVDQVASANGGERTLEFLRRRLREDPGELRTAVRRLPLDQLPVFLAAAATGPDDPIWAEAERIRGAGLQSAYARFLSLATFSDGLPALEADARDSVIDAIADVSFPDADFAELCLAFAQLPGRSGLWPWLAVAASAPDRFPPEILEPAVIGVTGEPPENEDLTRVAWEAAQRLGASDAWTALDHARWLQLLCTSPEGGFPTDFGAWLATGLAQAVAARPDGITRLVEITATLGRLGPNHPALQGFLGRVLPQVWGEQGFPVQYRDRIYTTNLSSEILAMWRQVVGV